MIWLIYIAAIGFIIKSSNIDRFFSEERIRNLDFRGYCDSLIKRLGGGLLRGIICTALMLCGCTTVQFTERGGSRTYLGVVRVTVPDRSEDTVAYSVKALGVGWQAGPWLGWRSDNWVEADPTKCQLLVVIRSAAEARNAADVLRALGGQNACVADYTGTMRH